MTQAMGTIEKPNAIVPVTAAEAYLVHDVPRRKYEARGEIAATAIEKNPKVPIEYSTKNHCRKRVV